MKTLNDSPARYAAQLAETIGSLHRHLAAEQPDWWQQVVAELHSRLDKEFPPFYDDVPDVIPPWKGGNAPDEQPDFLQLPEMAPTRMNLLDWRQNGFEARLVDLETWTDINSTAPDCIHNLIAEGMTGVTTDMHEHLERLTRRIDDLQDLLLKAVLKVDALETKAPC